ncbi:MAG: sugar phosphate isomerase/epimerase [Clostridia bacterium]
MKIGISTASFFTNAATEDAFQIIESLGIELCEVFLTTFREYLPEFGELLKSKKDKIEVYSIHTLSQQYEPELYNPMQRTREDCEFYLKQAAQVAKTLNARYYTFHGPARLKRRPYVFDYEKLGRRSNEIDDILIEYGNCRLCYENVHWTYFSTPEYFENLKKHSKVLACLDIKQAMQSGISVYDYIDCMGDRLSNVHLCDYDENGKLAVPGKGTFDFTALFRYLIQTGYKGALIMELYAGDYNNYDDVKRGYEHLYNCLKKAEKE